MDLSKMGLFDLIRLDCNIQWEIASRLMFLFIIALVIFCFYYYYENKVK